MDKLSVRNVHYDGLVNRDVTETLARFSYDFTFGKSYLLDAELGHGAWALCWMIGGAIMREAGEIKRDQHSYSQKERLNAAWFVRFSEFKGVRASHRTVQAHVRQGLKVANNPYLRSEQEIIAHFNLAPERYNRAIRSQSSEGWRASCAIGMAYGKQIFCFPYLEYLRPGFVDEYHALWLKNMFDLLRDSGALVLIPARAVHLARTLCDEIVRIV